MNAQQIISYHQAAGARKTLLVDDVKDCEASGISRLSEMGIAAEDLWLDDHFVRDLSIAVVSKPRSAADLFRILENLERLMAPGGKIWILPYTTATGPENRYEATEAFLGIHPDWTRRPTVNVTTIELQKPDSTAVAVKAPVVSARTAKKRVISLAVFGHGGYWMFLPAFVRAHLSLFPGYELRIHHDDALDQAEYGPALHKLEAAGLLRLVHMAADGLARGKCRSMLWRLAPAWDPEVEYVFCRDLDSLPTWRERCADEEFITSGRDLHTIHDAEAHCGVMGGLCAVRAPALARLAPSFEDFVDAAGFSDERWAKHGADQDYLNGAVRPHLTTFGHSLRIHGHNRDAAMGPIPYVTEIAPPKPEVIDSVLPAVREGSDALSAYMGVAGYQHEKAIKFFDQYGPNLLIRVQSCER